MSVRLFHRGARLVLVLRSIDVRQSSDADAKARWLAIHRKIHPWDAIFVKALGILDLPADAPPPPASSTTADRALQFGNGYGEVRWTPGRYWTSIDLCLRRGAPRKRQLIATALLKAARYQVV